MYKRIILFPLLIIAAIFLLPSLSCQHSNDKHANKLKVYVDERMELLTTVQYLSDYFLITKADLTYKKDIDNYFGKFKNHPLIPLAKAIIAEGYLNGSAFPYYVYQFSFPGFQPEGKITEEENQIEDYEKHLDTLELFKKELNNFYIQSNFHQFFIAHQKFYDTITAPVKNYIMKTDIVNIMEKHYGQTKKSYNLIITPLLHSGGFGVQVHKVDGDELFGIVGPTKDSKTIPVFPPEGTFQNIAIHEFSHSFCNPIIHKNFSQLAPDSCLEDTIFDAQDKQGYGGDWETCLFEHLTRANEIVLCKIILGKEKADKRYNHYFDDLKWIYLKGLVPLIEDVYMGNRNTYKTENDLVPKIINYLDEEKKKNCH